MNTRIKKFYPPIKNYKFTLCFPKLDLLAKMDSIQAIFKEKFSSTPLLVRAPGRINLIGEHTDYNEGFVLPAAIDKGISFALAKNDTDSCRLYACDLKQSFSIKLDEIQPQKISWVNYLLGVVDQLQKGDYMIGGFDCVFGGDVPLGAGLSSSAALESGLALGLSHLFELDIPALERVKIAQRAEHTYPGVQCGIMDMFASTMGKADHVIRLDCRSLEYEWFPFQMDEYQILLCNTLVSHSLADSAYNTRRKECLEGVRIASQHFPNINSLRDLNANQLQSLKGQMPPIIYQRCNYIIEENMRVLAVCEALEKGDIVTAGQYLYQSHHGLQHDYEVSCAELDFLVDQTRADERVLGARMMGGGFGGCTINLVKRKDAHAVGEHLSEAYKEVFGKKPEIYFTRITDGVRIIS